MPERSTRATRIPGGVLFVLIADVDNEGQGFRWEGLCGASAMQARVVH